MVKNCEVLQHFDKCWICKKGYFLNEQKQCEAYPIPRIENCMIYYNYNVCTKCIQGFHLINEQFCKEVIKIDKCIEYNQESSAVICLKCEPTYIIQSNACIDRITTIEKCTTHIAHANECEVCESGYDLTTDRTQCLLKVDNCKTYNNSPTETNLQCEKCIYGYFLQDSNSCQLGNIANCLEYTSSILCSKCDNKFYWDSVANLCQSQTDILDCDIYSSTELGVCDQCTNDSVLLEEVDTCIAVTTIISNCTAYSDKNTCSDCRQKYYLDAANNRCVAIPLENHCLEVDNNLENNCTLCEIGFLLDNLSCVMPLQYEQDNCLEQFNPGAQDQYECEKCKEFTYPWTNQNFGFCVTEEELIRTSNVQNGLLTSGCIMYNQDLECLVCEEDKFLNEANNSCISSCTSGLQTWEKYDQGNEVNGEQYFIQKTCDLNDNSGCAIRVPNTANNGNGGSYICIKCATGFFPSLFGNEDFVSYNPNDVNQKKKFGVTYTGVNCLTDNNEIYLKTNNLSPTPNCELFSLNQDDKKICDKCKFGYSGPGNTSELSCDEKILGCNLQSYFGGFFIDDLVSNGFYDFRLLNCHQCIGRNKIPIIFADQSYDVQEYGIEYGNEEPINAQLKTGHWMQCLEPIPSTFMMSPERFTAKFPQNCGVAQFYVEKKKDYRTVIPNQASLICKLCKPGFKAIRENQNIIRCKKIQHCDDDYKNKWFNSCSKCRKGYTWFYDGTKIAFDKCIPTMDENCAIGSGPYEKQSVLFENVNFDNIDSHCILCNKGYSLDREKKCVKLEAPLCKQTMYRDNFLTQKINFAKVLVLDFLEPFNGCRMCEDDYYLKYSEQQVTTCINVPFLTSLKDQVYDFYIPHCRNYKPSQDKAKCKKCEPGYVNDESRVRCYNQRVFPNCQMVNNNGEECLECEDEFANINGFCEKGQIPNCVSYFSGEDYQRCEECANDYNLKNNECLQGHVANCKVYDDQMCSVCHLGFKKLTLNDRNYCIGVSHENNCKYLDHSNIDQLSCATCNDNFITDNTEENLKKGICLKIEPVTECKTYNNNILKVLSTFECVECTENYYLKEKKCKERKIITQFCLQKSIDSDFCETCADQHYMNNYRKCIPFPTGIPNCLKYSSTTTCEICATNRYLENNTCVEVNLQNRIENCKIYQDSTTCMECTENYYLWVDVENAVSECREATALNCMSYEEGSKGRKCSKCQDGFGFQENTKYGTLNCTHISSPNCLRNSKNFPFECLQCEQLFFIEKGKCLSFQTFIPNCKVYSMADKCQQCDLGFILTPNKKMCHPVPESEDLEKIKEYSCLSLVQKQKPVCVACKPGYLFSKSGKCIPCQDQIESKGCSYCGYDQEEEICIVCKSGFFMSQGNCIENGIEPVIEIPPVVEEEIVVEPTEETEPVVEENTEVVEDNTDQVQDQQPAEN